jgi:RimJ/RimL family protein N-acetyltransferase
VALQNESFVIEDSGLMMVASLISWDTEIFSYPIGQIERIKISDLPSAEHIYAGFESWRDAQNCGLISCRLSQEKLKESMFLEAKGFRFIETVLHPKIVGLKKLNIPNQGLLIAPVVETDLPVIRKIAESGFKNGRFHVDPRLDPLCADTRYGRWVATTLAHPRQRLLKVLDDKELVAFFIIEVKSDGKVYWHLTVVAPEFQGRGYGRRTWLAMLRYHSENGYNSVSTTISARNVPVLNLYASLSFKFVSPEMTFHWIKK